MSGDLLLNRVARVTVYPRPKLGQAPGGGYVFDYPGFRIQFKVDHNLKSHPNTAEITMTNLGPESRLALSRPDSAVQLEAGYDGQPRLLFFGDVRFAESTYSGTDWTTKILAGDGAHAYARSRVNRSYKLGTSVLTVVRDCARSLGLAMPKNLEADPELQKQFASGHALEGWARDRMTELLAPFGYTWSIQHGKLLALRDDDVRQDAAFLIDVPDSMVGSPELSTPQAENPKKRTCTAKVLLYPEIAAGSRVRVRSRNVFGDMRAERVTHTGDTHGQDWTTEVEGVLR